MRFVTIVVLFLGVTIAFNWEKFLEFIKGNEEGLLNSSLYAAIGIALILAAIASWEFAKGTLKAVLMFAFVIGGIIFGILALQGKSVNLKDFDIDKVKEDVKNIKLDDIPLPKIGGDKKTGDSN